jgi:transketolase
VEAWKVALTHTEGPVALILSRQNLPVIDRTKNAPAAELVKGGYVLNDPKDGEADLIVIATGSEVSLALSAQEILAKKGVKTRLVSMPSWELFEIQPEAYRNKVLPPAKKARLVVEAGVSMGWHRYAGEKGRILAQDRFGASAPEKVLRNKFGFTPERVAEEAMKALQAAKS